MPKTSIHTIYVNSSNDSGAGTLRQAIIEANTLNLATKIILTSCVSNVILLTSEITISTNIKLINQSGHNVVITTNVGRIFHVTAISARVTIKSVDSKIILLGGTTEENGGAIHIVSPFNILTLINVILKNNQGSKGGGIYTLGRVVLIASIVKANQARIQGGGIWSQGGVTLLKSKVIKNSIILISNSYGGGGIFVDNGDCIIDQSIVACNSVAYDQTTGGSGGGIVVLNGSIYVQNNSHLDNNSAYNSGGIQEGIGNVYVTNKSTVNGNTSFNATQGAAGGGGITITLGSVYIESSQVCANKTVGMFSGGIVSLIGEVVVTNSQICANSNCGPGGGIALNIGNLTVTNSKINDNIGASLGGGIVNFSPAPSVIAITKSKIVDNTLTNAEVIRETIAAFLSVIEGYLNGVIQQSITAGGEGGQRLITEIPLILARLLPIALQLQNLSLETGLIAGAGIATLLTTNIIVKDSSIQKNVCRGVSGQEVPSLGGGIFSFLGNVNIAETQITKNSAAVGGGIWSFTNLHLTNSSITKNSNSGIFCNGKNVLIETKIIDNFSDENGGGINNHGNLSIFSSLIKANKAKINGGGIFTINPLYLSNTLVIDNLPDNIAQFPIL